MEKVNINPNIRYRTTNAASYITNGKDYQVFPEGIRVAKVIILRNVLAAHVTNVLYQIGYQILALNPHLIQDNIIDALFGFNSSKIFTSYPTKPSEIMRIVKSIFIKREKEGELVPIENHTRKIIFSETTKLTKEEKYQIKGRELGAIKREITQQIIIDVIENWDLAEKITAAKIAKQICKCVRTVKNYWSEVKLMVKVKNEEIKSIIDGNIIDSIEGAETDETTISVELPVSITETQELIVETETITNKEVISNIEIGNDEFEELFQPVKKTISIINDTELSLESFTSEQIEILGNFNPPNDAVLFTHFRMEFAKDYLIRNASKIKIKCFKNLEFELLVGFLVDYELNRFENELKRLDSFGFKDYYSQMKKYVNEQKTLINSAF